MATKRGTTVLKFNFASLHSKYCLLCNDMVERQDAVDFDECRGTTYRTISDKSYNTFSTPRNARSFMVSEYYVCADCMAKKGWKSAVKRELNLQIQELGLEAVERVSARMDALNKENLMKQNELRDQKLVIIKAMGVSQGRLAGP